MELDARVLELVGRMELELSLEIKLVLELKTGPVLALGDEVLDEELGWELELDVAYFIAGGVTALELDEEMEFEGDIVKP